MKIKHLHLILEDQTNMKTTSLVEQLTTENEIIQLVSIIGLNNRIRRQ